MCVTINPFICATYSHTGAQARLVHQQLSTHLRGALQHQLQQANNSAGGGGQGVVRDGTGYSKLASHMQALGLGAVTAEVQEGQPGALALDYDQS
jgi:hypothetical protein